MFTQPKHPGRVCLRAMDNELEAFGFVQPISNGCGKTTKHQKKAFVCRIYILQPLIKNKTLKEIRDELVNSLRECFVKWRLTFNYPGTDIQYH